MKKYVLIALIIIGLYCGKHEDAWGFDTKSKIVAENVPYIIQPEKKYIITEKQLSELEKAYPESDMYKFFKIIEHIKSQPYEPVIPINKLSLVDSRIADLEKRVLQLELKTK